MAGFCIHKVDFSNTPSGVQTFSFWYKLWSAPESSYILISASEPVNTNGTLQASPPVCITGLTSGQLYYLRAANNCSSPIEYFVQQIQL